MDNEYVYFQITRAEDGSLHPTSCMYETMFSECMMDAAIVGIRFDDLGAYYLRTASNIKAEILRGWFIVKMWDGITREDIAEAIKYG